MTPPALSLQPHHATVAKRMVELAEADLRIAAVALVGSNAAGLADSHSDIDLFVFVDDTAFGPFLAERDEFIHRLGEVVFLTDFGRRERSFFILADGTEGELTFSPVGEAAGAMLGPWVALVDKDGLLNGVPNPGPGFKPNTDHSEFLGQQVQWFWHDFSHLVTALSRGQLWWAYGQLEVLRSYCVNLLRLEQDFDDPEVGAEPYWKVDKRLPAKQLDRVRATQASFDPESMRAVAAAILSLYREVAIPLAAAHGVGYPEALARVITKRFEALNERA